jgi:molybdenum cofactor cytidylyltransferase
MVGCWGHIHKDRIAALVLAAGQSIRMGRPKMTLPWGDTTVIGRVVSVLAQAGLEEILVVTGGARQEVENALLALRLPSKCTLRNVYNSNYVEGEMLSSFQLGLSNLGEEVQAALIVLGDQPQIQEQVIDSVMDGYQVTGFPLIIPSYRMRRGHPWLLNRSLWFPALALKPPQTLRDFLQSHGSQIHHVLVETDTIFQDLDTPNDYQQYLPQN